MFLYMIFLIYIVIMDIPTARACKQSWLLSGLSFAI